MPIDVLPYEHLTDGCFAERLGEGPNGQPVGLAVIQIDL